MKNIRIILEDISKRELNETLLTPRGKMLAGVAGVLGALGVGGGALLAVNNGGRATQTAPATAPVTSPSATAPVATPTAPVIAPEKPKQFEFASEHVRRLYGALVSAEHRGVVGKDPIAYDPNLYIRTKVDSDPRSSAYGPVQITRSTARGFVDTNNEYNLSYIDQGTKFLKADNKDSTYGLGRAGDLFDAKYHNDYLRMSQEVMFGKAKELKIDITKRLDDEQLGRFVQHWRHGIKSPNRPESWYSEAVNTFYANHKSQTPSSATQQQSTPTVSDTTKQDVVPSSPKDSPKDSPEDHNHTVVSGDTLSLIAKKNKTTVEDIIKSNPDIVDPNKISVGQKVKLPKKQVNESCGCEHKKLKSRMRKKIRNKLNEET